LQEIDQELPGHRSRLYQMNHCVSIPMIFVSAIFASLSRQMTRAPKWRLLPKCVIAHVSWRGLHLLPKWRPTRVHKKSRTQFWLSDSSGIIYHLWPGVSHFKCTLPISPFAISPHYNTSCKLVICASLFFTKSRGGLATSRGPGRFG
jgi:hypothetical protein